MRRTFLTLFPRLVPPAFNKGVGRLAYHFSRDLGWDAGLAYLSLGEVTTPPWYAQQVAASHLGATTLDARGQHLLAQLRHLTRHGRSVDLLNLYDLRPESLIIASWYKQLNPRGRVFIKTDMDQRAVDMLLAPSTRGRLYLKLLEHSAVDFFTVETRRIHDQVAPLFEAMGKPLHIVPIGVDPPPVEALDEALTRKERLIVAVGRTGSQQKHNELLLEAFLRLPEAQTEGWRVVWIGEDEAGFRPRAEAMLASCPQRREQIVFIDHLHDRAELLDWYSRASVFALSSRWESFGTVLVEGPSLGALPVSTRVGAAMDVTQDGALGFLCPPEDLDAFTQALGQAMSAPQAERERMGRALHAHIEARFSWRGIVTQLAEISAALG